MGATISSDLASQGGAQSNLVRERERRKKVTGFATLRKKLISRRRRSSKHDHGRILREFVSNWSPAELFSLLEEYEALSALKDLSMQAELARQPATTFKGDLSTLYDCKLCTDCDLVFRGNIFPVHRAVLSGKIEKLQQFYKNNLIKKYFIFYSTMSILSRFVGRLSRLWCTYNARIKVFPS